MYARLLQNLNILPLDLRLEPGLSTKLCLYLCDHRSTWPQQYAAVYLRSHFRRPLDRQQPLRILDFFDRDRNSKWLEPDIDGREWK